MSRCRKSSRGRRRAPKPPQRNDRPPDRRTLPEPNPPRPNKPLLAAAGVLLAAWIAFLLVLALTA